jgi:hypothetical protein
MNSKNTIVFIESQAQARNNQIVLYCYEINN